MTAIVYVTQLEHNPAIKDDADALYLTVTALTATGCGGIIRAGIRGHIPAVLIMIFGIALFLCLIQTILRPEKARYECPNCGLSRHEGDAVHRKQHPALHYGRRRPSCIEKGKGQRSRRRGEAKRLGARFDARASETFPLEMGAG